MKTAWLIKMSCQIVKLPHAQAPEVLMGGKCGSKVDIFRSALSVLLLVCGPWHLTSSTSRLLGGLLTECYVTAAWASSCGRL
jgi:hypothetical protein